MKMKDESSSEDEVFTVVDLPMDRVCLCCDTPFTAHGKTNRLCAKCKWKQKTNFEDIAQTVGKIRL